jgi:hypothetical protein
MRVEKHSKMLRWAHLPECESPVSGWRVCRFTDIAEVIAGQSPVESKHFLRGVCPGGQKPEPEKKSML